MSHVCFIYRIVNSNSNKVWIDTIARTIVSQESQNHCSYYETQSIIIKPTLSIIEIITYQTLLTNNIHDPALFTNRYYITTSEQYCALLTITYHDWPLLATTNHNELLLAATF